MFLHSWAFKTLSVMPYMIFLHFSFWPHPVPIWVSAEKAHNLMNPLFHTCLIGHWCVTELVLFTSKNILVPVLYSRFKINVLPLYMAANVITSSYMKTHGES